MSTSDVVRRRRVRERLSALLEMERRQDGGAEAPALAAEEDRVDRLSPEYVGQWLLAEARSGAPHLAWDLGLCEKLEEALDSPDEEVRRELPSDIDPHDLSQAGWGVVFAPGGYRRLRQHLEPLLELREQQAGSKRCKRFTYRRGESGQRFLEHHGETLGTIRPQKVPYYLLIVGGPEAIPFEFQYHLSLNHAVGRIDFADPRGFARYAEHVRAAERDAARLARRAVLFSVERPGDRAGAILAKELVRPLYRSLSLARDDWQIELRKKSQTTKQRLARLLADEPPALFVAATHGCRLGPLNEEQAARQGALRCHTRRAEDDALFAAADLDDGVDLRGQIAMLFACYSAGLPRLDNFPEYAPSKASGRPPVLAKVPFVARLPQEMLQRGTLAVLGHVDRGWSISFQWPGGLSAVASLEDAMRQLLRGERLGHALRPLQRRYAFLAASLSNLLDKARHGAEADPRRLGIAWTAVNDARNFIVLGDPAVYLRGHRSAASHAVRLSAELWARASQEASRTGVSVEEWVRSSLGKSLGFEQSQG